MEATRALYAPWHFLYFLPLPQGQGSLRPGFSGFGADDVADVPLRSWPA
jgi:hypothetical protein